MKLLELLPPTLTFEEEVTLATKIEKHRREDDINALVLANMKEAFVYSKAVCRGKIDDGTLFSLCYTVLVMNAKRFRTGRGTRFFSFAKVGIRGAITRYWKTAIDTEKHASEHKDNGPISNRSPLYNIQGQEGDSYDTLLVTGFQKPIDAPQVDCLEHSVDADYTGIDVREKMVFVDAAMRRKLTEQERMILDLVYKNGFNFEEIGKMLGLTRSAAQLSHMKAIKKIRNELLRKRQLLQDKE
jgi:RNA polymerase sigma factor (sigma-70 family)